ncbi:carboxypeptidase-like regulatory domain-containing protein [Maribacter algicola]|uniref:Carboxypeptidase-like regulatory domain-containing protein n=1 Tax=Meishania litoralis TaxID=3434685 RepID=A0ACC7LGM8_9FLAO
MSVKYSFYVLIFVLLSCGQKTNDFYQGVVLDENNIPLENVTVFEEYVEENSTKTDNKGYFKLNRTPNWILSLVFVKEGYKTDTIPTVWAHGEQVNYQFIKNDTTQVRLKKENSN